MKRALFLGFDGVLHPTTPTEVNSTFCRATLLESALDGHQCDVVISSSWRHHYSYLELLNFLPTGLQKKVVGVTGGAHIGKWPRFSEIQNYILQHGCANWRALDDSFLEFPPRCPELIRCNPNDGVTTEQAKLLGIWLTGG
jgi:HAD domain in Swiss Army Knife RNA repair proteins